MDKDTKTELDYLLHDKAYEILKWVALIALPAVAWLVGAVGPQWGLPHWARSSRPSTPSAFSSAP